MSHIVVPYHLDEDRPNLDIPLPADVTITAELPEGDTWHRMAHLYERVATAVADDIGAGQRPTVMSGDCTVSMATVAGMQRAGLDPAIVWFDAHGDVQTLETSTSGYLGGMPLRMLVGYRPELIAERLGLLPVAEEKVVLVDARDLDSAEIDYLHDSAITRCGVYDLVGDGAAVDRLPPGPIYLHVDFDVVDPGELPDTLFPAPGGPGLETVLAAIHRIKETGRVAATGLGCTWRPGHGSAERILAYGADALG
ncbi:arginase family protein [Phytoactinopolyspora alkaliphila]|uniref:Arginase family protein n=1 Tax=Phytoactinopolyspora alkaliphila TaxID=1783498 RepID=A0A6N9YPM8_9ACTN|nr:arginase family protein [Phytoactinopolyspora alkaliphila]NED96907.1 arginase family protein [Phytoactinopolyspora alkaliphila]